MSHIGERTSFATSFLSALQSSYSRATVRIGCVSLIRPEEQWKTQLRLLPVSIILVFNIIAFHLFLSFYYAYMLLRQGGRQQPCPREAIGVR